MALRTNTYVSNHLPYNRHMSRTAIMGDDPSSYTPAMETHTYTEARKGGHKSPNPEMPTKMDRSMSDVPTS